MFQLKGTTIVPLTRELAEEFSTMPSHSGERRLRPGRLEFLHHRLQEGMFHTPKWATATLNGKRYRVNGQHSSTMLAQANGHFPVAMHVVIDEFACDTDQDLAELFAQFDNAKSTRTAGEMTLAHARVYDDLRDIKPTTIERGISGIAFAITNANELGTVDAETKSRLVHSNRDFLHFGNALIGARMFCRAPVIAAIYTTWKVDAEACMRFWKLTQDESHPDRGHPTRILSKLLNEITLTARQKNAFKAWTSRAIYVKCLHAWNAYRKGTTTELKYHAESPLPKAL